MGTIKRDKQFDFTMGGKGIESFIQNNCKKCGWNGQKHYAHNDYQHSNCEEERLRHKCESTEERS